MKRLLNLCFSSLFIVASLSLYLISSDSLHHRAGTPEGSVAQPPDATSQSLSVAIAASRPETLTRLSEK